MKEEMGLLLAESAAFYRSNPLETPLVSASRCGEKWGFLSPDTQYIGH
jgi:hypothetical protein